MHLKSLLSTLLFAAATGAHAQWNLSGNSNATSTSKLGTTNAIPLNLTTNNVPRVFIASSGRIGIGTTSPLYPLHVEGPTLLSVFVSTDVLGAQSGSGVIGYTKFQPTAAGQRLGYFLTGSQGGGSNAGNGTGMVGYSDGAWSTSSHPSALAFETASDGEIVRSERMRITSLGYVGIGNSSPQHRLDVADGNSFATAIYGDGGYNGISAVGGSYGLIASTRNGAGIGMQGYGQTGVSGSGTLAGVFGLNSSTATSGSTYYGVHGVATTPAYGWGVFGEGSSVGVLGRSTSFGVDAQGTGTGSIGIYAFGGSYAGYFSGSVYTTGTYQGSDKKLKKNIEEFTDAVAIINKLKPKTYEFLTDGKMAELQLPAGKHYGLIAQDLETVLPNLIKETELNPKSREGSSSGSTSQAKETFKAVNYTELIPILIKGMQEQDAEKEELKQRVQTLEQTVQELKALLLNNANGSLSSAHLEVATPNPAKGNTTIGYGLPAASASAKLIVVNMSGQVVKQFSLTGAAGTINLNVSNLASGSYPCTLWVNGQALVSKQLVVAH